MPIEVLVYTDKSQYKEFKLKPTMPTVILSVEVKVDEENDNEEIAAFVVC